MNEYLVRFILDGGGLSYATGLPAGSYWRLVKANSFAEAIDKLGLAGDCTEVRIYPQPRIECVG